MDKFKLTQGYCSYVNDGKKRLQVSINDMILADFPVDFSELTRSISEDGECFIFTCTCGEPGCAGIFYGVIVLHEADVIRWKAPNPMQYGEDYDNDQDEYFDDKGDRILVYDEYCFDRKEYIDELTANFDAIR